MSIDKNMFTILEMLVIWGDSSGEEIKEITNLSVKDINNAIDVLNQLGFVEVGQTYGTAPFNFASVAITPMGLYELEKKQKPILTKPLEDIALTGLENLGYKLVEEMTTTPSGSSIDFIADYQGKEYAIEVKNRKINTDDLRGTLNTNYELGTSGLVITKEVDDLTREFAEKYDIEVYTIDEILERVQKAEIPTKELQENIMELNNFIASQTAPANNLIEQFKETLENSLEATTNKEKKDSLENLGKVLVEMIDGLEVIDMNVNTDTEEIDLLVKNESKEAFWQRLPSPILIECKNWTNPVRAKDIRDFDGKMREINFRIMITLNGITGKDERHDARGVIRDARKEKRFIIILDKEDLRDIAEGLNPAEKINEKYYELFKL